MNAAEKIPFTERLTVTVNEACTATGLGRTKIYEAIGDADPLGQHDEGVVMQVLSTFGQPIDAARRIKENQQLLPRPALGIAGGVVALVCGTVAAFLIVLPLTLPDELVRPSGSAEGAATDLFAVAVAFDFVTFYAARRTVRVSAAISRQMATRVGRWWAVVCIPLACGARSVAGTARSVDATGRRPTRNPRSFRARRDAVCGQALADPSVTELWRPRLFATSGADCGSGSRAMTTSSMTPGRIHHEGCQC